MSKRAPPSASDDRTLKPGKTIGSTAVNISDSDALKTGRYRVTCESNGISGLSASAAVVVDVAATAR